MTLETILKSKKIENDEQANIFIENAKFYEWENGLGDFRIDTDNGYAEIYGHYEDDCDDKVPIPDINQKIRFFNKDMESID